MHEHNHLLHSEDRLWLYFQMYKNRDGPTSSAYMPGTKPSTQEREAGKSVSYSLLTVKENYVQYNHGSKKEAFLYVPGITELE